jgi:hypothetical protein
MLHSTEFLPVRTFTFQKKRVDGRAIQLLLNCQAKIPQTLKVYKKLPTVIQIFIYLFIPRFLAELLTIFCGAVVGKHLVTL